MCDVIEATFQPLVSLANALGVACTNDQTFRTLGLTSEDFLAGTLSDLHIILWKFIIIHIVAVDEDGRKFEPKEVWRAAVRRQRSRLEAHAGKRYKSQSTAMALPAKVNWTHGPAKSDPWPTATTKTADNWLQTHGSEHALRALIDLA